MKELRTFDYLQHIVEASTDITHFIDGLSKRQFEADRKTQKAVVMSLIEIGEAATKISASDPEFVAKNPAIPWSSMRGMRNRIAHRYFDIDYNIVWDTVQPAVPDLNKQATETLERLRSIPHRGADQ